MCEKNTSNSHSRRPSEHTPLITQVSLREKCLFRKNIPNGICGVNQRSASTHEEAHDSVKIYCNAFYRQQNLSKAVSLCQLK